MASIDVIAVIAATLTMVNPYEKFSNSK